MIVRTLSNKTAATHCSTPLWIVVVAALLRPIHRQARIGIETARHVSRTSYFQEAKRRARMEETASITIQRDGSKRLFIRNINRHLRRRTLNKQSCRGASSYAKELVSTGSVKSPAPAPSISHRGLSLPPQLISHQHVKSSIHHGAANILPCILHKSRHLVQHQMSCMDKVTSNEETTSVSHVDIDVLKSLPAVPIIRSIFLINLPFRPFEYHRPGTPHQDRYHHTR